MCVRKSNICKEICARKSKRGLKQNYKNNKEDLKNKEFLEVKNIVITI